MKGKPRIKSLEFVNVFQKHTKNETKQVNNYMRDCRARKREEKKSSRIEKTSEKIAENKMDFESHVPFSTIVVTNRIMTPQDLQVRGHCKRPKPPRKMPKTPTQRTRDYRQRKKVQQNVPEDVNQTKVINEIKTTVEPSTNTTIPNTLQYGYVLPQAAISSAPIFLPYPLTTNPNPLQIGNMNDFQPIQNMVLPQTPQPLFNSSLIGTPTISSTLQFGNVGEILPFQNIIIPQANIPGHSFLLSVPTISPAITNTLQIGNMGQVLLIENNVQQTPISAPPSLVVVNGNLPAGSEIPDVSSSTKANNQQVKSNVSVDSSNTKNCNQQLKVVNSSNTKTCKQQMKSNVSVSSYTTKTSKRPVKSKLTVNQTSSCKTSKRPIKSRTSSKFSSDQLSMRDVDQVTVNKGMFIPFEEFDRPEYWHPEELEFKNQSCRKEGRNDSRKKKSKRNTEQFNQKKVINARKERHKALPDKTITIKQEYEYKNDIENVSIKTERLDSDDEKQSNSNYATQDLNFITNFVKKEEIDIDEWEGAVY